MVLAQNIERGSGFILLSKGNVLNNDLIKRLLSLEISKILIIEDHNFFTKTIFEKKLLSNLNPNLNFEQFIKSEEAFIEFEKNYEKDAQKIKHILINLSNGIDTDLDLLPQIAQNAIENLKFKNDIFSYLHNLKSTDDYTFKHSMNVSMIACILGYWLDLDEDEIKLLALSGMLHDIGKIKINYKILTKKEKLNDLEFEEMKNHTIYGFDLIKKLKIPYAVKMAVLMHHERFDGSGYPLHAENTRINKFAKIISICDIYDAMTSDRCYREKLSPFEAIAHFEKNCYGHLDTNILMIFLQNIACCYLNRLCKLSNDSMGKIIFINKKYPSKPIIFSENTYINLQYSNLKIESIL